MHPQTTPRKASTLQSAAPVAALLIANVALAFGPWFVRLADIGPVASGFWRLALGAPVLAALCVGLRQRPTGVSRGLLGLIALGGLSFAADLAAWHVGILHTTLANATLFGNSATLIFPIYGFLLVRSWPSRAQTFALLLALAGGVLLMGRSYSLSPDHLVGDLLCLLAGILYTGYFIVMLRAQRSMAPLPALTLSTLFSAVPLLLFALMLGEAILPHDWWPLIGLSLISQVLGQGMMIYALGRLSPLIVGIALLIQPIVAAIVGWTIYGETLGIADVIGAICVAAALALVRSGADPLAPGAAREDKPQP